MKTKQIHEITEMSSLIIPDTEESRKDLVLISHYDKSQGKYVARTISIDDLFHDIYEKFGKVSNLGNIVDGLNDDVGVLKRTVKSAAKGLTLQFNSGTYTGNTYYFTETGQAIITGSYGSTVTIGGKTYSFGKREDGTYTYTKTTTMKSGSTTSQVVAATTFNRASTQTIDVVAGQTMTWNTPSYQLHDKTTNTLLGNIEMTYVMNGEE